MTWEIREGDCVERMRELEEAGIDAIVTDPPYGIRFMGKAWDGADIDKATADRAAAGHHRTSGNPDTPRSRGAREAGTYDLSLTGNQAFQVWTEDWAREAFRILKPGGHLLSFAGSRTYHRMASGVEDAGFEIRDSLIWLYGSGFPKSLDVSKAIDKAAGIEREAVGQRVYADGTEGSWRESSSDKYAQDDWTTDDGDRPKVVTAPATPEAQKWNGWGTALKPAHEPVVVARKPLSGTVVANVTEHGTGALNIDGCRIEAQLAEKYESVQNAGRRENTVYGTDDRDRAGAAPHENGRWPANVALSPEAAAELDEQSGELGKSAGVRGTGGDKYAGGKGFANTLTETGQEVGFGDSGGASRFFYCAKASRGERNAGLDGFREQKPHDNAGHVHADGRAWDIPGSHSTARANHHPTVKPIDLMRWLVRLVTPPGGTVLDPFTGSGTTGIAAVLEGFDFIGIERESEYAEIAKARVGWWAEHEGDTDEILGLANRSEKLHQEHEDRGQMGLLATTTEEGT